MIRVLCLFFIIQLSFSANSQNWFEDDDLWVYRYFSPFFTSGYGEMYVSDRFEISGKDCVELTKKIRSVTQTTGDSSNYELKYVVYEELGQVFLLNDSLQFDLIMDFNLEVGDSLTFYISDNWDLECRDSMIYYLDSLSFLEIGNQELTVQYFSYYDDFWDYSGVRTMVEKVGVLETSFYPLHPHTCAFDLPGFWMCSFKSSGEELSFTEQECYDLPSSNSNLLSDNLRIFPNPCSSRLFVEGIEGINEISVYNSNYEFVLKVPSSGFVDVSSFNAGIYFLVISDTFGKRAYSKFFKN